MPVSLALLVLSAAPVALVVPGDDASRPAAALVVRLLDEAKVTARLVEPAAAAAARGDFTLTVTAAEVRGRTALDLELVSRRTGKRLDTRTADGPSGDVASFAREPVRVLAAQMRVAPAAPPKPKVEPVEPTGSRLDDEEPEPQPAPAPPAPESAAPAPAPLPQADAPPPPPPAPSRRGPIALLAGAAGALFATATFGAIAAEARLRLDANDGGVSPLGWSQAAEIARMSNLNAALASTFGALTALLLIAGIAWWLTQ